MSLDESLKNLATWADALARTIQSTSTEIREAFEDGKELPEGCPSPASLAELCFQQVKKRFHEVEAAVENVEKAIWAKER